MSSRKVIPFHKKPQKVSFKTQEQIRAENKKKREEALKKFDDFKSKDRK